MRGTPFVVLCCPLLFMLSFSSFRSEPCEEPPFLSLVVYCCSSCRFLLSVPSPARNLFVQIRVIRVIRGKIYSFRALRGPPLLTLVVYCCSSCRFFSFRSEPCEEPCCPLLFMLSFSSFLFEPCEKPPFLLSIVVYVVVFFFSFRAMRETSLFYVVLVVVYKKTLKRRSNLRLSDAH